MCGVIGLVYEREMAGLGVVAAELLQALEYRGYDSTGAAVQGEGQEVRLVKGVGAPSVLVHELGITGMSGRVLCGQVRWATFGAVDDLNAQPHLVRCRAFLYGAHNGNVTNCDDLKLHLLGEGHAVLSDNDGEMLVHTVEHCFARELEREGGTAALDPTVRGAAMRRALVAAAGRLEGSYAAVVVDPVTATVYAVKQGSSLYFGVGTDPVGGRFAIASSDLSCVLKLTRTVVPLHEGEMVEFSATAWGVHAVVEHRLKTPDGERVVAAGERILREPVRSRLRAKDTALLPPFRTFMEQEISAQEQTCRNVVRLAEGGSEALRILRGVLDAAPPETVSQLVRDVDALRDEVDDARLRDRFHHLVDLPAVAGLLAAIPDEVARNGVDAPPERLSERLVSSEAGLLSDLLLAARSPRDLLAVRLLDALLEREEVAEFRAAVDAVAEACASAVAAGGRLYAVSCGSSYHAAKAASLLFNELCGTALVPILPGEYRGQYARALASGDVLIAVSQSGETKDLIDVLNDVSSSGAAVRLVGLVNNLNSTLALEKCDLVIPLHCGPEIAVPATKSFMNQMVVFYCVALTLAERLAAESSDRDRLRMELAHRRSRLHALPDLIRETFHGTAVGVERAAALLYLEPSLHILATRMIAVAEEGALKVREVVLNHTEGVEGSEFKHGPNTILGFDTVMGPAEVETLLARLGQAQASLVRRALERGMPAESVPRLVQAAADALFDPAAPTLVLTEVEAGLFDEVVDRAALLDALHADYPLVYVTGPDERDVALTISQINTHKIRGAKTVVIAEDHPALRQAAGKAPADNPSYQSVYIDLPRTNDRIAAMFSATVVLQRLALKMSELKAGYLDRLGIPDHGVHPDVPKNVSKSITVD